MTNKLSLAVLSFVSLSAALVGTARASSCVQLDPSRDTLVDADRNGAVAMLEQTLARMGKQVARDNCQETFYVYHVRLGQSVNVYLQGPQGVREGQAAHIEELPQLYDQMVRSLLTGVPMNTATTSTTRDNVTNKQASPRRVDADQLWYARLGYGVMLGGGSVSGPALGFGYRYELDSLGIDVSFFNIVVDSDNNNSGNGGLNGSWVKLMGLYYFDPVGNGSLYAGGGVSWGGALTSHSSTTTVYSGSGLQGEVVGGFEFLRASTIRLFFEIGATLPAYTLSRTLATGSDKVWVPTFTASLGLGWGRGMSRVQVLQ